MGIRTAVGPVVEELQGHEEAEKEGDQFWSFWEPITLFAEPMGTSVAQSEW